MGVKACRCVGAISKVHAALEKFCCLRASTCRKSSPGFPQRGGERRAAVGQNPAGGGWQPWSREPCCWSAGQSCSAGLRKLREEFDSGPLRGYWSRRGTVAGVSSGATGPHRAGGIIQPLPQAIPLHCDDEARGRCALRFDVPSIWGIFREELGIRDPEDELALSSEPLVPASLILAGQSLFPGVLSGGPVSAVRTCYGPAVLLRLGS